MLSLVPWSDLVEKWFKITKATGTTIVINEDPITEEGVIEILGTDPAGIEAVLAKINHFQASNEWAYEVK
jgi:polyribonucleotide nucleotidyltransferase